jgi:uncharacterized Zn-binding protein involved in type VI secretion
MATGKPITRLGDKSSKDAIAVQGTSTIFINGFPVVVVGDSWSDFSTSVNGCPNVFFENKAVVRIGDSLSNSAKSIQGSSNTFAGYDIHKTWAQMVMAWKDAIVEWIKA